jgi:maltooligosyltrehalose trehalohydrolase
MTSTYTYDLPFGANLQPDGRTKFRIWAPSVESLKLDLDGAEPVAMEPEQNGWFSTTVTASPGCSYAFQLPDGMHVPDPASRRQRGGVHGRSMVVDPGRFSWRHTAWQGRPWAEAVIYELHPGLCGGFAGVQAMLPGLRDLGVTVVELMPVAEFPGERNWGYDGTLPFSPDASLGTPDELKQLIDTAHGMGICMMLDVVYNHFGPDGAYIHLYAKDLFTEDFSSPWGAGIDFRRNEVREYFIQNAIFWLNEYRFDGLRFDAVHAIQPRSFLDDLARDIHAAVEPGRHVHLVLENEDNEADHLKKSPADPLFDAQWTDDFHHIMHVLLTGERGSYYVDYAKDTTGLLARSLSEGFAFQGELSPMRGVPRGTPSAQLPPSSFVVFLQNHDQVGNRATGERINAISPPDKLRAATALVLLAPMIPLLFMGEEWNAKAPFYFFTDHNEELAQLVREGRAREFNFEVSDDPDVPNTIPDPNSPKTFDASRPERDDAGMHEFYKHLLSLRHAHVIPGVEGARSAGCDVLAEGAVAARWQLGNGTKLTILCNLSDQPVRAPTTEGGVLYGVLDGNMLAADSTVMLLRTAS